MSPQYKKNYHQLTKGDLTRVILRSFLFQGSWSFKKMQNLGFAFSILPALGKIYPHQKEREAAVQRHLEFYNSHPYMASFVLGAVIRMEEKYSQGGEIEAEDIMLFKKCMMGPMGALGDSFFWVSLRPALGVFTAALALIGWGLAPVMFLFLYNVPHFFIKIFGVHQGYALDKKVVEKIRQYNFFQYGIYLKSLMLIILGAMIPIVIKFEKSISGKDVRVILQVGILAGIFIIVEILRRKVSFNRLLFIISCICILLGLLHIV